jgi:hypothetical protein
MASATATVPLRIRTELLLAPCDVSRADVGV